MARSRSVQLIGSRRRGWTAGLAVFAFSAVAVLATACGGGGSGSGGSANGVAHIGTTTPRSAAGMSREAGASASGEQNNEVTTAGLVKLAYCMRSHGAPDFPMPTSSSNVSRQDVSIQVPPQFRPALQSCKKYLPAGQSENITPADQKYYVEAAQCMRAHGIKAFPDPTFSNGTVHFPVPAGVNDSTPQFEAARHTCENLIPNGLPRSG